MSARFAFFEVKGLEDIGFEILSDAVSSNRFNNKSTSGFIVDKKSNTFLESRFVEKLVMTDTFTDPFGNAYNQERIQFNELRFLLRTQRPQLTVWNGNSAFKAFSGRLLELADFRLSIKPLIWQALDVVEKFHSEFQTVVVYAAVPHSVNITPAIIVRLAFEGSEDVRKHVRSFLKLRKAKFSSLKFQFESESRTIKCEVKEGGTLALFGECDPFLVEKALGIVDDLCASM
jgi:hypothetical protein